MQVQDTDLKLLRIFETIVRCGGFAAAQPILNIGASSISEYMSQLETRLGLRLCERGRAGFRLTEEGAELHAAAQRLLGAVDTFHMEAGALRNQLSGVLRFGMIEATLTDKDSPLPMAIREFGQMAPEVRLHVQIETPGSMEQHVLDGRLHLAVGPFPRRFPVSITCRSIVRNKGSTVRRRIRCTNGRAAGFRFRYSAKSGWRPAPISAARNSKSLHMPEAAASVDNVEGRAMLILSGNYIGFLPPHYAEPWVNSGLLIRIDPEHYATHLDFQIVTRKGE